MSTQKPKKWMQILLVCSLALNLLIIGVIVGAAFKQDRWRGAPHRADLGIGPMTHALAPQDRRELGRKFRRQMRQSGTRGARKAQFEALITSLKADPFDPAQTEQILMDMRSGMKNHLEQAQGLLVGHLSTLTPQERAAYADRLQSQLKKRRKKRNSGA